MTIVAVNGGGNTPNGNAASGANSTLGEVDDEMLVFPTAHAGDSKEYMLTSVQHAATDTSDAGAQDNSKQPAIDAIHYGNSVLEDVTDGTTNTLMVGERPPTEGHDCLVFLLGGIPAGDVNDDAVSMSGSGAHTGGCSPWLCGSNDPHMETPAAHVAISRGFVFDGSSQTSGDDGGIAWVSGAGGTRGADTAPEADWLLL